ncbi:calcium ATPase [Exidia glandulosa HHB12029]|uniref:Calcium ATPase n=1 Tax=Exidia glandulosa HHB12029 TaxID=1314781 RepID=A0A165L3N4_EXIGL|nr:calcium ATPase [Exidia glandulosa HHB12029]
MASISRARSMSPSRNADLQIRYRTMSLRLDEPEVSKGSENTKLDAATALREMNVHLMSPQDIFTRFSTHPERGLDPATVTRKANDGKNKISPPPTQYWKKGLNYVFGGFNFLMWIAFIVTVLSYKPLGGDNPAVFNLGVAVLLLLVIIVSSMFYALVDWNASRIMNSIKSLVASDAVVIRDLHRQTIAAEDIVVGDLVELTIGQRCPADMRLIKVSSDCKFDRSLLTGESDPVPGTIDASSDNPLETKNLALMSTFLVSGSCAGIVFQIGDNSVMGRLVSMSANTKLRLTTIQREVWFITKIVSCLALGLFAISLITWATWLRTSHPGFATASGAIINSIGCLTAFVPQGLPVCVALSLTIVAKRMAKRHVLVKNLATIETLGCMSVLCSDKTGTLTEGRMAVLDVAFADTEVSVAAQADDDEKKSTDATNGLAAVQVVARLCNGAKFHGPADADVPTAQRQIVGDATDTAILRFAEGLPAARELAAAYVTDFEIPFNSRNKWMVSIVHARGNTDEHLLLVKGAPDRLFDACTSAITATGDVVAFNDGHFRAVQDRWAADGLRVLALCRRSLSGVKIDFKSVNTLEEQILDEGFDDLTLVGLVGLRDPPRPDVKGAVEVMRRAHVKIFMVTGDYMATAIGIAKKVGIITNERVHTLEDVKGFINNKESSSPVLDRRFDHVGVLSLSIQGVEVDTLSPMEWDVIVSRYQEIVFARTSPEHKLRIVEAIKGRNDNTVAVTGDGVNDAPALQAADIGVAMGAGSDVAKDAAAMVLLNNDFASIPVAIENGRLVFDNLKKVIIYLLPAGSYTEFMAVLANVFLGMQIPLSSYLQVFFCILNDVVMSVCLMYEKPESDLMIRRPRNARKDRLTDWRFFVFVYLFMGLMMWPTCMAMWFLWFKQNGFGFYDLVLVFDKWTDGYKGHTIAELTTLVSTGQCIYYVTMVIMQYGGLLSVRNRRVSILQSNPLWGPRRNLAVPLGMLGTVLLAIVNLYGPGLQKVFGTHPIPGMFWGLPFAFATGLLLADETRKLVLRTYPDSLVAKMAW